MKKVTGDMFIIGVLSLNVAFTMGFYWGVIN